MLSKKRKSILKRISIIIITLLFVLSVLGMATTKIVYDSIFERYDGETVETPQALSQMVKNRELKEYHSGENLLQGYLYKTDSTLDCNGLVVFAPGFHSGADSYLWQIKSLCDYGWSVFAFDSTGSYGSEGDSTVGFPQIIFDMEATLKYIENNNRFGYNDIVLLGHSRGGYAACCALYYDYDISAVVSISGVNSAMEGVIGSSTQYVGSFAYSNYGFLWLYQALLFGSKTLNMSADDQISNSDVPVMIVHGNEDTQVPMDRFSIISHSDEIDSQNVKYYVCDKKNQNGHTNLLFEEDGTANKKLMEEINTFLLNNTGD